MFICFCINLSKIFETEGKTLTGLWFVLSKGSLFLKTDVISANFKFPENSLFDNALFKSNCKVVTVTSALCRNIFRGILLFVVALFEFKPVTSFLMSDSITCLKTKTIIIFYFIFDN